MLYLRLFKKIKKLKIDFSQETITILPFANIKLLFEEKKGICK